MIVPNYNGKMRRLKSTVSESIHTGDEGAGSVKQINKKLTGRTQLLAADILISHFSCQLIVVKPLFCRQLASSFKVQVDTCGYIQNKG